MKLFAILLLAICAKSFAQRPLREIEEQHHKVVFQNKLIRIVDLVIPPGDTTLPHLHDEESVVVFLSPSRVAIQNEGQAPAIADVKPGTTVYRGYGEKPVIHRVWSEDGKEFKCMVVEALHPKDLTTACPDPVLPGLKALWHERTASAFALTLSAGKDVMIPASECDHVLFGVSGTSLVGSRNFRTGDFRVFHDGMKIKNSSGAEDASLILLQLPKR